MNLTQEEIKNLIIIISRAETMIRANEVQTVSQLQNKLTSMLEPEEIKEETK